MGSSGVGEVGGAWFGSVHSSSKLIKPSVLPFGLGNTVSVDGEVSREGRRALGFDGYTDNAYFGPRTIEFDAVETGIPMVLDRTTRLVVAKGNSNVRVCIPIKVPAA